MATRRSIRQENLNALVAASTSAAGFSRATGVDSGALLAMRRGDREVPAATCRDIEARLGLPANWMEAQSATLANGLDAQVKELTLPASKRGESPELSRQRLQNINWLVGEVKGAKKAFCAEVQWHKAEFSQLQRLPVLSRRARSIEFKLRLPDGWLDQDHQFPEDFPDEFHERLQWARGAAVGEQAPAASPAGTQTGAAGAPSWHSEIKSLVVRAALEKLIALASRGLLTEDRALELLNEAVALERGTGRAIA